MNNQSMGSQSTGSASNLPSFYYDQNTNVLTINGEWVFLQNRSKEDVQRQMTYMMFRYREQIDKHLEGLRNALAAQKNCEEVFKQIEEGAIQWSTFVNQSQNTNQMLGYQQQPLLPFPPNPFPPPQFPMAPPAPFGQNFIPPAQYSMQYPVAPPMQYPAASFFNVPVVNLSKTFPDYTERTHHDQYVSKVEHIVPVPSNYKPAQAAQEEYTFGYDDCYESTANTIQANQEQFEVPESAPVENDVDSVETTRRDLDSGSRETTSEHISPAHEEVPSDVETTSSGILDQDVSKSEYPVSEHVIDNVSSSSDDEGRQVSNEVSEVKECGDPRSQELPLEHTFTNEQILEKTASTSISILEAPEKSEEDPTLSELVQHATMNGTSSSEIMLEKTESTSLFTQRPNEKSKDDPASSDSMDVCINEQHLNKESDVGDKKRKPNPVETLSPLDKEDIGVKLQPIREEQPTSSQNEENPDKLDKNVPVVEKVSSPVDHIVEPDVVLDESQQSTSKSHASVVSEEASSPTDSKETPDKPSAEDHPAANYTSFKQWKNYENRKKYKQLQKEKLKQKSEERARIEARKTQSKDNKMREAKNRIKIKLTFYFNFQTTRRHVSNCADIPDGTHKLITSIIEWVNAGKERVHEVTAKNYLGTLIKQQKDHTKPLYLFLILLSELRTNSKYTKHIIEDLVFLNGCEGNVIEEYYNAVVNHMSFICQLGIEEYVTRQILYKTGAEEDHDSMSEIEKELLAARKTTQNTLELPNFQENQYYQEAVAKHMNLVKSSFDSAHFVIFYGILGMFQIYENERRSILNFDIRYLFDSKDPKKIARFIQLFTGIELEFEKK